MTDQPLETRFNAYLDGEMSEAERAEFDALLETDAALRTRLERWRVIEAGLGAFIDHDAGAPDPLAFAEAETVARPIPLGAGSGEDGAANATPWFRRPVFAAAAAVLLAAGGYVSYTALTGGPGTQPLRDSYLYAMVAQSFEPAVVCDTPEKFLDYTERTLSEPITADFDGAATLGVTLVGWDTFGGAYSEDEKDKLPRVLMALGPGGEKIVVYFEGPGHRAPEDDPTNRTVVTSKTFGSVTAHELSPLGEPVVLGLLGLDG